MNRKTTIILALILASLAAYYFIVEKKLDLRRESTLQSAKELLPYGIAETDRVLFRNPAGKIIEWEKDGEEWTITSPAVTPGSKSTIDYFVRQMIPGRKTEEFDAAGNFADFGLASPYSTVIFFNDSRSRSDTLHIGDPTPVKTQCYVRLGSSPNITVTRDLTRNLVNKSLYHLRDKHFTHMALDSATSFTVRSGEREDLEFEKKAGVWLIRGTTLGAEKKLIEPYLTSLGEAIIREFTREDTTGAGYFGIYEPHRSFTVYSDYDTLSVSFGREEDGMVYVIRSGLDKIIRIEDKYSQVFDWLKDDVLMLNLASYVPGEVGGFTCETPDTTIDVVSENGTWRLDGDDTVEIRKKEVEYFLAYVRGLALDSLIGKDELPESRELPVKLIIRDRAGQVTDLITITRSPSGDDIGISELTGAAGVIRRNAFSEVLRIIDRLGSRRKGD